MRRRRTALNPEIPQHLTPYYRKKSRIGKHNLSETLSGLDTELSSSPQKLEEASTTKDEGHEPI